MPILEAAFMKYARSWLGSTAAMRRMASAPLQGGERGARRRAYQPNATTSCFNFQDGGHDPSLHEAWGAGAGETGATRNWVSARSCSQGLAHTIFFLTTPSGSRLTPQSPPSRTQVGPPLWTEP